MLKMTEINEKFNAKGNANTNAKRLKTDILFLH